jgi:hypothetical protein
VSDAAASEKAREQRAEDILHQCQIFNIEFIYSDF